MEHRAGPVDDDAADRLPAKLDDVETRLWEEVEVADRLSRELVLHQLFEQFGLRADQLPFRQPGIAEEDIAEVAVCFALRPQPHVAERRGDLDGAVIFGHASFLSFPNACAAAPIARSRAAPGPAFRPRCGLRLRSVAESQGRR